MGSESGRQANVPHSLAGSSCVPFKSKPAQTPPPYVRSQEASAFYIARTVFGGGDIVVAGPRELHFCPHFCLSLWVGASFWQLQLLEIRESLHHSSRELASPFPTNRLHLPCMIKTTPPVRKGEQGSCCKYSSQRNTELQPK